MPKLPNNFDWKNSLSHLRLLGRFVKPNSVEEVLKDTYLVNFLKEEPQAAIDRLLKDGALAKCDLADSLSFAFKIPQLKAMLKERELTVSGGKDELIQRLIKVEADRASMESAVSHITVLQCTKYGLDARHSFEQRERTAREVAKRESFKALLDVGGKEAFRIRVMYKRQFSNPSFSGYSDEVETLRAILSCHPKVLDPITSEDLRGLQAAVCMAELWREEKALDWLPDTFVTHLPSRQIAINYLEKQSSFKKKIATYNGFNNRVKVIFDQYDFDSCERCLALNGEEFEFENFPELPMEGCTSQTGCKCRLDFTYKKDDFADSSDTDKVIQVFGIVVDDDKLNGGKRFIDPLDLAPRLKRLQGLLDDGLITRSEYENKRTEILSEL